MMRNYPEDDYDRQDLEKLNADPWMVELLKLNPDYTSWGPHEDYMIVNGQGWNTPQFFDNWAAFQAQSWHLDSLNECVNFYFSLDRASIPCPTCAKWADSLECGRGYNRETAKIAQDFYDFAGTGRRWADQITEDEVDALIAHGRLGCRYNQQTNQWDPAEPRPTADEVNAVNRPRTMSRQARPGVLGLCQHDAINRGILIEARATRLGVYGMCSECEGACYVYTEPYAHVKLVLWWLHPRKGCSRGIQIQRVAKADLPGVFKFLKEAADRNAARFARVVELA